MALALVKIKIMPESPDVNLDKLETEISKRILDNKGLKPRFEREPIAFGLVAIIAGFAIDESNSTDPLEEALRKIENVSSAEIIDFRRAVG
jgi:elongation factor 1-beta